MEEGGTNRGRVWRWRWWVLGALLLIVAVRVALPAVLRKLIVSQTAANLRAEVELGNVDLYLWRGGVVLEDFVLRPRREGVTATPDGQPTAAPDGDGLVPAGDTAPVPPVPPILAFKRLAIGIRYRPLVDKTIRLYEIQLDAPRIALDRLADGQLNVMGILPPSEQPPGGPATPGLGSESPSAAATATVTPEPTTAPDTASQSPWRFGVDRVAIAEGKLTFRDLMLEGSEPVDIDIPTIEVQDIALDPQVYGGPSSFHLKVLLDDGSLDLGARLHFTADGATGLESELEAQNLPLRRARIYVPEVGWSDLRGQVDTSLKYKLEPGVSNELRGWVALRDIGVSVPDLPDSALSWKSLKVSVDPVDVLAQNANVTEVALDGVVLTVVPQSRDQLPILKRHRAAATAAAETGAGSEAAPSAVAETPTIAPTAMPTPSTSGPVAAEPTPEGKPWHWALGVFRLTDSLVRVEGPQEELQIKVSATVEQFSDGFDKPGRVDLELGIREGSLHLGGDARIDPPGFGGTLVVKQLSLPEILSRSGAIAETPLLSAKLDIDYAIAAGLPSPKTGTIGNTDLRIDGKLGLSDVAIKPPGMENVDVGLKTLDLALAPLELPGVLTLAKPAEDGTTAAGDIRVQGELTLAEPRVRLADGKEFAVGAKTIRLAVAKAELPGVITGAHAPQTIALRELRLDAPSVKITRTAAGLVLPGAKPAAAPVEAASSGASGATPTPATIEAAPAKASPASATAAGGNQPPEPATRIALQEFRLRDGRVDIVDRAVKPEFKGALSAINVQARDIRWPDPAARDIRLTMRTPGNGEIEITGTLSASEGSVQFEGRKVDLSSFNPYATSYSPFRLSGGAASVSTKIEFKGEHYDLGNNIVLHQLDVGGGAGESLFEKEFGIPLATALALLKDGKGNITFDVPVQMDREGTKVDIMSVVGGALRQALVNALMSPLRLLGAVTGTGEKVDSLAPAAVACAPGRAELAAGGDKRLTQLGDFLASRPGMAVELATQVTQRDVRWLREQALAAQWEQEGLFASLLSLGQRGTKARIQAALAERAEDGKGELSAEDSQVLDAWLAEQPPIPAEDLAVLAAQRLDAAAAIVRTQAGVDAGRVRLAQVPTSIADGEPEIAVTLETSTPDEPAAD